jgi:hypothetical protein
MKNELVRMDLDIEVLEHRVELIAAAGGCSSSSSSCSNIVVIEVLLPIIL